MKTKSRTLLISAATLAISIKASGQKVATQEASMGRANYFYEEQHPTKIDWGTNAWCAGRDSAYRMGVSPTAGQSSDENAGSAEIRANVDGPLQQMIVSSLSWNNSFDDQDYVFHVIIHKRMGAPKDDSRSTACNTHHWQYRPDALSASVKTSVHLAIPANVWVMMVKTSASGRANTRYSIERARALPDREDQAPQLASSIRLTKGAQYFFTRPGEDFEITADFKDETMADADISTDFEITFIGQNRCDKTIREVMGDGPGLAVANVGAKARDQLKALQAEIARPESEQKLEAVNRSVVFMGCLINESVANSVLFDNDPAEIRGLLQALDAFTTQSADEQLASDVSATGENALKVITQMSLLSLATNSLNATLPYCEHKPVFGEDGDQSGWIRGYLDLSRRLQKAKALYEFNESTSGPAGYASYYRGFMDRYQPFLDTGLSYGSFRTDPERERRLLELATFFDGNNKVLRAYEATGQLSAFGTLPPNRDMVEMAKAVLAVERLTARIHSRFAQEFEYFIDRSPKRPNLQGMREDLDMLDSQMRALNFRIGRLLSLLNPGGDGEVAEPLKTAVQEIATDFLGGRRQYLRSPTTYGAFLTGFTDSLVLGKASAPSVPPAQAFEIAKKELIECFSEQSGR